MRYAGINQIDKQDIFITENDMKRLQKMIFEIECHNHCRNVYVESLQSVLSSCKLIASTLIPTDVITMNSRVYLEDLNTGEEMVYTLVFPEDADISKGKISVLAPIGTAMLGYRVGDTFAWKVPDGIRTLKVKEVLYQPEACGDYQL